MARLLLWDEASLAYEHAWGEEVLYSQIVQALGDPLGVLDLTSRRNQLFQHRAKPKFDLVALREQQVCGRQLPLFMHGPLTQRTQSLVNVALPLMACRQSMRRSARHRQSSLPGSQRSRHYPQAQIRTLSRTVAASGMTFNPRYTTIPFG
eukprot:scaffold1604_cov315-Prasinococcus_capsulatus_cf.AAC.7